MPAVAIDPPVGGLNAFDSVANMPPTDAVLLTNWLPRSGFCESRPGSIVHQDDLGSTAPVETLAAWKGDTGIAIAAAPRILDGNAFGGVGIQNTTGFLLLAAAGDKIFDVSVANTPVTLGTGFTNARWQSAMINNVLVLVNGEDSPQEFDGTTLSPITTWQLWNTTTETFDPFPSPEELIGCVSFKGRMYYWKDKETKFYYAQAGGYKNEMFEFDLGSVLQQGGWITAMFTWTVDPGVGPDDMLVILFNTGEFLIYQGDDPGNLGYFEQVGRFTMPDPLSTRCHTPFGGDVVVMTRSGYVNLETVIRGTSEEGDYPAFSRKIGRAVIDDGTAYAEFYGHEPLQTDSGWLIFNVPESDVRAHQYIINPNTRAWARMEGLNAVTWEVYNNGTYYGGMDGKVYRLGGNADGDEPIALDAIPAFNYWGDEGNQKQILAAQIISTFSEPQNIGIVGLADFDVPRIQNVVDPPPPPPPTGSQWNTSYWSEDPGNSDYYWTSLGDTPVNTTKGWQNVHAFGYAVSLLVQMKISSAPVQWRQTGLRLRMAGAH